MFQKLRIAIGIAGLFEVLLIMVQKGKAGMAGRTVDPLEVQHELVVPLGIDGRMRGEQFG